MIPAKGTPAKGTPAHSNKPVNEVLEAVVAADRKSTRLNSSH